MRVTAPMFVCPVLRPFSVAGEHRLGISVASAWTLAGAPLSVQALWPRFLRGAGQDSVLDQGFPKSASEWLLVGHAHALEPVPHLAVSVEIGSQRKVLNVIGDRTWQRGVPTSPAPFTSMPLTWERAFGGEGYRANPRGVGYVGGGEDGAPLPNLEQPGSMIRGPGDRPPPACFAPLGLDWPHRFDGLGTYDSAWFENDYPGFARDVDWRVHNVASEDQRRESPFAPNERIALHNLVEGRPYVELNVPAVAARCFTYADEKTPLLVEVPLALKTLWLLPDEDMIVVVFHGSRTVASMLASDVRGLVLALDAADRPRDLDHYARTLARRLDAELGAIEMLDDAPLMPEGLAFPGFAEQFEDLSLPVRSGAIEENLRAGAELRRQEALRIFAEAGFEGGESLFPSNTPPPAPTEPLGAQTQNAFARAAALREEAQARLAAFREEARRELENTGANPDALDAARAGPPPIRAEDQLATLREVAHAARAAGHPVPALERQIDDPAFHEQLAEQEMRGREAYRRTAHRIEALPPTDADRAVLLRARVEAAIRERRSLAREDLTGADLTELDLSGMELTGAWLEGADLQLANLEGACFDGAVLAKADLTEARLRGASFVGANLGRARLLWNEVLACDFSDAVLSWADFRGARLLRSSFVGADLTEIRTEQTLFQDCDVSGVTFVKTALPGCRFVECKLDEATFVEAQLEKTSFEGCRMPRAVFVGTAGAGATFYGTDLENARVVAGTAFDRADFRKANLARSTLRGGSFVGANFDEALLRGSDLSQADLSGTRFYRADLREVLATECNLRGAVMTGANLMFAVLQGADLRGTDLRNTNLFSADLALVRGDSSTALEGALVTRVRHRPLRKETA